MSIYARIKSIFAKDEPLLSTCHYTENARKLDCGYEKFMVEFQSAMEQTKELSDLLKTVETPVEKHHEH